MVESKHGPAAKALPVVSWTDGLQFARTHEMSMEIMCAGLAGLHEDIIKKR
jgi:hypothetical protein